MKTRTKIFLLVLVLCAGLASYYFELQAKNNAAANRERIRLTEFHADNDLIFSPGGNWGKPELILKANGDFVYRGKVIATDKEVFLTFKKWFYGECYENKLSIGEVDLD